MDVIFIVMHSIQAKSPTTRAVQSYSVHCPDLSVFFISVCPSTYLFFCPQLFVVYIYIYILFYFLYILCYCSFSSVHSIQIICCFVRESSSAAYLDYNPFLVGIYICWLFIIMSDQNFDSASRCSSKTARSRSS